MNIDNQSQNYQDIPQRNLKKHNFHEINIFPSNNLKRKERIYELENQNKLSPKVNNKIIF